MENTLLTCGEVTNNENMAKEDVAMEDSAATKWAYGTSRQLIDTNGHGLDFDVFATFESVDDANREIRILAENEGQDYEDAGWESEEDEYGQLILTSGYVGDERIVYEVGREDFEEAVDVVMEEGSSDEDEYDDFEGEEEADELAHAMGDARISKR